MTTEQPLALRLADWLQRHEALGIAWDTAGDELRRLHAENEALREALQAILDDRTPWGNQAASMAHIARAALAQGEKT
jgi:hypothetical protein